MNRSFPVIVLVLGVLAPPSEAVEDAEHQHVNAPVERSGLRQVIRGDGFDPRPLHDLPVDIIPEIVLLLDQSRARRLNDPYTRNTNNIENYPMYMLALKLEQHRVELLGSNRTLYDEAIESLVKSIDGRAGGYHLDGLLKLNDQSVRKALKRSKEAEEKAAPRREAWWKVIATSNNWSPWQWSALGGILALVGWPAWRRLAKWG